MAGRSEVLVYDVAVIGAGVIGSAAAYQIAKTGLKVVLLEQFDVGHTRGSSHGGSRITRHLYNTDYYTKMTIEAFPLWEQVEKESGITVYRKTGLTQFAPKGSKTVDNLLAIMKQFDLPVSVVDAKEAKDKCPYITVPDNFVGVFEEDAGILATSKCVTALQNVFIKSGGKLLDCYPITEVVPGNIVVLKSSTKEVIRAKKVVITVGPWAKKFLELLGLDLPLRTVRNESLFWEADPLPDNGRRNFNIIIVSDGEDTDGCYMIPEHEYPGLVKISYRSKYGVEVDPDARDAKVTQDGIEITKKFISKYCTGISTTPSVVEPCIVTVMGSSWLQL
ncbi:peroxisomal sarcosine oxidase-like isoform X2 [Dysidea avara]|uniref:peroxisomal sarcosine oxidase-like isoform X2 n=1 Tax=Dysidea avara TaxID=196820 RepID=UPI003317E01E